MQLKYTSIPCWSNGFSLLLILEQKPVNKVYVSKLKYIKDVNEPTDFGNHKGTPCPELVISEEELSTIIELVERIAVPLAPCTELKQRDGRSRHLHLQDDCNQVEISWGEQLPPAWTHLKSLQEILDRLASRNGFA